MEDRERQRERAAERLQAAEEELFPVIARSMRNLIRDIVKENDLPRSEKDADDMIALVAAVSPRTLSRLWKRWEQEVDRYITPAMLRLYRRNARRVLDDAVPGNDVFIGRNIRDVRAVAYMPEIRKRLVGVGHTMQKEALAALRKSLERGESIDKAAARVRKAIAIGESRSRTIARTEAQQVLSASDYSVAQELEDVGIAYQREWIATTVGPSATRTRPEHFAADGQVVGITQPFLVGGALLRFPGDPLGPPEMTVNCRCSTALRVEEDALVASFREELHPRDLKGRFVDVTLRKGTKWFSVIDNKTGATTYVPMSNLSLMQDYLRGRLPASRVKTGRKETQILSVSDPSITEMWVRIDQIEILKAMDRDGHFDSVDTPPAPTSDPHELLRQRIRKVSGSDQIQSLLADLISEARSEPLVLAELEDLSARVKNGDFLSTGNMERLAARRPLQDTSWPATLRALAEATHDWEDYEIPRVDPAVASTLRTLSETDEPEELQEAIMLLYDAALKDSGAVGSSTAADQLARLSRAIGKRDESSWNQTWTGWTEEVKLRRKRLSERSVWTHELIDLLDREVGPKWDDTLAGDPMAAEADLKSRYGTLHPDETTPEAVISTIGQFYSIRTKGTSNCVLAAATYEMRRRGIDVQPKRAVKGRNAFMAYSRWFRRLKKSEELTVPGLKGLRERNRYGTIAEFGLRNFPVGSRGSIRSGWKDRSYGHIWNWEITEAGRIEFYDPQTGKAVPPPPEGYYWREMDYRHVSYIRLDDKPLHEDIEVIVAPKELTDQAKTIRQDRFDNERASFEAEVRRLQNRADALLKRYQEGGEVTEEETREYSRISSEIDVLKEKRKQQVANSLILGLQDLSNSFPLLDRNTYR